MKVMRWGDNMRNVAVTEGDKTEAERVFGASINTWAVNELVAAYEAVKDDQVKSIIEDTRLSTTLIRLCSTPSTIPCSSRPRKKPPWST